MSLPTPDPTSNASCTPGQTRRYRVFSLWIDATTQEVVDAAVLSVGEEKDEGFTPLYQGKDARRACEVLGGKAAEEVAAALVKAIDAPGL